MTTRTAIWCSALSSLAFMGLVLILISSHVSLSNVLVITLVLGVTNGVLWGLTIRLWARTVRQRHDDDDSDRYR